MSESRWSNPSGYFSARTVRNNPNVHCFSRYVWLAQLSTVHQSSCHMHHSFLRIITVSSHYNFQHNPNLVAVLRDTVFGDLTLSAASNTATSLSQGWRPIYPPLPQLISSFLSILSSLSVATFLPGIPVRGHRESSFRYITRIGFSSILERWTIL